MYNPTQTHINTHLYTIIQVSSQIVFVCATVRTFCTVQQKPLAIRDVVNNSAYKSKSTKVTLTMQNLFPLI